MTSIFTTTVISYYKWARALMLRKWVVTAYFLDDYSDPWFDNWHIFMVNGYVCPRMKMGQSWWHAHAGIPIEANCTEVLRAIVLGVR